MTKWGGPPDLAGRVAVVTGATGGIGLEAAAALAGAGADVTLTGRNAERGAAALAAIRKRHPAARVAYEAADMASLASIAAFAERWAGRPLDVLLNNAGVMAFPKRLLTPDGFEMQFGTNHLGHYALTARLMPALLAAPAPRVVTISSLAHKRGRIGFDDLQAARRYVPWQAYSQSKLANLMFALELHRRAAAAGGRLASMAAHPGLSATNIASNTGSALSRGAFNAVMPLVGQPAARGALPGLYAATAPEARSGGYYGPNGFMEFKGDPAPAGVVPRANDPDAGRRLWEVSAELTAVEPRP